MDRSMPSRASSSVLTRRSLRRGCDRAHLDHALAERATGLEIGERSTELLEGVRRPDRWRDGSRLDHREQVTPLLLHEAGLAHREGSPPDAADVDVVEQQPV